MHILYIYLFNNRITYSWILRQKFVNRNNSHQIIIFANRNNIHVMIFWQIGIGIYSSSKYQQIDLWQIYLQIENYSLNIAISEASWSFGWHARSSRSSKTTIFFSVKAFQEVRSISREYNIPNYHKLEYCTQDMNQPIPNPNCGGGVGMFIHCKLSYEVFG